MQPLKPDDPRTLGPYRLLARLGSGGMGVVYLGRSHSGRAVAVKVIRASLAADAEYRARFRREVRAAREVTGTFTAALLDDDVDAPTPWLATAYLPGVTLREAITRYGPMPADTVRALAAGLCEGLAAIHGAGIVHRDLKPGNVILAAGGPRLIDFGIARPEGDTTITRAGSTVGTPGFMSPEQVSGDKVGPAGDVFALGAMLAYAATGTEPFGAGPVPVTLYRVVRGQADLTAITDDGLRHLISTCLRTDPRTRPTAADLLDTLQLPPPQAPRSGDDDATEGHLSASADGLPGAADLLRGGTDGLREAAGGVTLQGTRWLPAAIAEEIDRRTAEVHRLLGPPPAPSDESPRRTGRATGIAEEATDSSVEAVRQATEEPAVRSATADHPTSVAFAETSPAMSSDTPPAAAMDTCPAASADTSSAASMRASAGVSEEAPSSEEVPAPPSWEAPAPEERGGEAAAEAEPRPGMLSRRGLVAGVGAGLAALTVAGVGGGLLWGRDGRDGGPLRDRDGGRRGPAAAGRTGVAGPPRSNGGTAAAGGPPPSLWRRKVGDYYPDLGVAAGVIIASTDDTVRAFDPRTGEQLWKRGAQRATALGDIVYVAPPNDWGLLAVHARSGRVRWTYRPPFGIFPGPWPAVGDSTVYIGHFDAPRTTALSLRDGRARWTARQRAVYGIAAGAGMVVTAAKRLTGLHARSGRLAWTYDVDGEGGHPLIADGLVVVSDSGGTLHAVRASSGRRVWRRPFEGFTSLATVCSGNGLVYVVETRTGDVVALRTDTGAVAWSHRIGHGEGAAYGKSHTLGLSGGTLLVGGTDRQVHALDAATGRPLWTQRADVTLRSAPVSVSGVVAFATKDGHVHALGPMASPSGGAAAVTPNGGTGAGS